MLFAHEQADDNADAVLLNVYSELAILLTSRLRRTGKGDTELRTFISQKFKGAIQLPGQHDHQLHAE